MGRQAGCQLLAALFADHPAAPAVGARSWHLYDGAMSTIIIAAVVIWLLPMILRGFAFGLLVVGAVLALHVVLLAAVALAQQQTRTTCYDSGNTRICETFDSMGNPISKSRCYRSGKDWRCDTTTINAPVR